MRRLQIGENIGDYTILGFLGAGGMGEVYQGIHNKINRQAAIKVLYSRANNATFITRFFNEARLQSSLHHPNIATLYDFQEINGQLYIFMEYADGERLEDMVARRAFTVEDALKTFADICRAIAFIHQNGIIHRDIKAQNIKLTLNGTVKLLDFGIAKDAASQRLTKVGGLIGTPNYLAPEQLAGREANEQTDIWAMGVLFYEMLTGIAPFKAETFGELHSQIIAGNFEAPENINPAVSRNVSQITVRCLEKHSEKRYQSVEEILIDVERVLRGEKVPSRSRFKRNHSKPENPIRYDSANYDSLSQSTVSASELPLMKILISSATAVILLFGLIGFGIWAMSSPDPEPPVIAQNSPTPKPGISKNTNPGGQQPALNNNLRRVRIEVFEGSAQVFRDSQMVGKTPFVVEGNDGESVGLTLKQEGFEDQTVKIDINSTRQVYTFSLKRK